MSPTPPHERKVRRWAWLALALATLLATLQAWPHLAGLGAALAGAIVGAVAILRRSAPTALAACLLLALGLLLAGGVPRPGMGAYLVGILFGAALVAFGECVHVTARHTDKNGLPQAHLDRVATQTLATLGMRGLLAAALAGAGLLLAWLLATLGPAALREGVETTAPLGVAVASLSLMGGAALFVLARGSRLRRQPTGTQQETATDAHD